MYQADDCQQKVVNGDIVETCANRVGDVIDDNSRDARETNKTIFCDGALIEDTLFFYGLYEMRDNECEDLINRGNGMRIRKDDDLITWHV